MGWCTCYCMPMWASRATVLQLPATETDMPWQPTLANACNPSPPCVIHGYPYTFYMCTCSARPASVICSSSPPTRCAFTVIKLILSALLTWLNRLSSHVASPIYNAGQPTDTCITQQIKVADGSEKYSISSQQTYFLVYIIHDTSVIVLIRMTMTFDCNSGNACTYKDQFSAELFTC